MVLSRSSLTVRVLLLVFLAVSLTAAGLAMLRSTDCPSGCPTQRAPRVSTAPAKAKLLVERVDGTSLGLEDIAPGRRVAIIVMKGTWCPVCTAQLERLEALIPAIEAANGTVVALTNQPPSENGQGAATLGLEIPILSDTDGDALLSFGLAGDDHPVPGVAILDESGRLVDVLHGRYPGRPQEDWIVQRLQAR